jgi:hypothetical protein
MRRCHVTVPLSLLLLGQLANDPGLVVLSSASFVQSTSRTRQLLLLFGSVSWSEWVFVKDSLGIHVLLQLADGPVLSKEGELGRKFIGV